MSQAMLILARNTTGMTRLNKGLTALGIRTALVPAPPETGTVCAIAVRVNAEDLETARLLISREEIEISHIVEDRKLKLQGLLDLKSGKTVSAEFASIIGRISNGEELTKEEIVYLLSTDNPREANVIFETANRIRHEMVGDVVEIRGAIEFSNYCRKSCKYCGVNAQNNTVGRYRMTEDEIMQVVDSMYSMGLKTVILQSGEDMTWTVARMVDLVRRIKAAYGMRVTLSVGERNYEEYAQLKEAGGDNFLLKIESSNPELFASMHPDDDFEYRLQCMRWLKELGYIAGSGNMIGLPGQTMEDIAGDILHFREYGINMIGIGPFIPAHGTPYEHEKTGSVPLVLRAVAVTRIVCQKVYIPATTALASLHPEAQVWALNSGANSIMLINTPSEYRGNYRIYDNKNMIDIEAAVYAVVKSGREFPKFLTPPVEILERVRTTIERQRGETDENRA